MGLLSKIFWLTVLVIGAGVSIAISQPENVLASPFRGMAIKTLETGVSMMSVFRDARTVAASHEYSIMVNALQVMQINENVPKLPVVNTPTNDMSVFPSKEHSLYNPPNNYLVGKLTEFSYTINSKGELIVDQDEASIDPIITDILEKLTRLENGENPETVLDAK